MSHAIVVRGLANPDHPEAVQPGKTVAILLDPSAVSRAMSNDMADTIGSRLEDTGYVLDSATRAQLFVLFGFGTDRTDERTFVHHVEMAVIDGETFRRSEEALVLWQGAARLADTTHANPARPLATLDRCVADLIRIFGESKQTERGQWVDEPLFDWDNYGESLRPALRLPPE